MKREFAVYLFAIVALFVVLLCWLIANPAYAQEGQPTTPPCGPLKEVAGYLESEHKEKLRWFGDISGGTRLAVLVSRGGTWTVIRTDGRTACIIFAGEGSTFQLGEPA